MTATERLRALLDERGVDWWAEDDPEDPPYYLVTKWFSNANEQTFEEIPAIRSRALRAYCVTPEQAVAATLGPGTCHAVISDNLAESEGTGDAWADCSECGHLLFVLTDPSSQPPNYCPECGRRVVE